MNKKQKQRVWWVLGIILTGTSATGLTLYALGQNINAYYTPAQIVKAHLPLHKTIRAGGYVVKGSFKRSGDGLNTRFILMDVDGSKVEVFYRGVLPALFREGQGIIVEGQLTQPRVIRATEVLAKHDENYHPPGLEERNQGPSSRGSTATVAIF